MSTQTTTTQAASGAEDLRHEATFLLARLRDFENDGVNDDNARDWYGHVTPSMERLRALATSPATASQSHPREERGQAGSFERLADHHPRALRAFAKIAQQEGDTDALRVYLSAAAHIEWLQKKVAASPAAPVTGTEGERSWLPMKDAPTGVPIIAKHKPNARMPLGWVATIKLGHRDDEEPGALDTILHYNGDDFYRGFHGCWEGWLPVGSAIPAPAPQPAGAERVDLGELERLSAVQWRKPEDAPENRPVLVAGGVAIRRDGAWYSITGEEWPGRPIQWEVLAWAELPRGENVAFLAKAEAFRAGHLVPASLATARDGGTGAKIRKVASEFDQLAKLSLAQAEKSGGDVGKLTLQWSTWNEASMMLRAALATLGATARDGGTGAPRTRADLPPVGHDAEDPTGWSKISAVAREASGLDQEALADIYNDWLTRLPEDQQNPHQFKAFLAGVALVRDVGTGAGDGLNGLCIRNPAPDAAAPAVTNARTVTIGRDAPTPDPRKEALAVLEEIPRWATAEEFARAFRYLGRPAEADRIEAALATLGATDQAGEVRE